MHKRQGCGVRRGVTALTVLAALAMGGSVDAADFTVEGNVKVGTPEAAGNLTVTGNGTVAGTLSVGSLSLGSLAGPVTVSGDLTATGTVNGNNGVFSDTLVAQKTLYAPFFQANKVNWSRQGSVPSCTTSNFGEMGVFTPGTSGPRVGYVYFCNLIVWPDNHQTAQLMVAAMSGWPPNGPAGVQDPGDELASLKRQVAALKALVCREHANEEACR